MAVEIPNKIEDLPTVLQIYHRCRMPYTLYTAHCTPHATHH